MVAVFLLPWSGGKEARILRNESLSCCCSNKITQADHGPFSTVGYPMAKNLRTKIPSSDTLIIFDRNEHATTRFVQEMGNTGSGVEVSPSARGVAEKAVRLPLGSFFEDPDSCACACVYVCVQ